MDSIWRPGFFRKPDSCMGVNPLGDFRGRDPLKRVQFCKDGNLAQARFSHALFIVRMESEGNRMRLFTYNTQMTAGLYEVSS